MIVRKCPKMCKFDWKKFHGDLDIVLAHMIEEIDSFLPSKARVIDLMEYSNKKRKF